MTRRRLHDEIRELLRHLDNPDRLQHNRYAAPWIAAGANIRDRVEQAILRLPERLRVIVVRCDLGKQLHSLVAADLAVSERHFYRLRRLALERLGANITGTLVESRAIAGVADPIGIRLSYATALYNAGNFDAARAALEAIQSLYGDPEQRARIACRLAEVCCTTGHMTDSRTHIESVERFAVGSCETTATADILKAEICVAKVKLAQCAGDLKTARTTAERVVNYLRGFTEPTLRERTAEALVSVLLILTELRRDEGAYDDALAIAFEAIATLDRCGVSSSSQRLQCMVAIANLRFFTSGGLSRTIEDLTLAYDYAQADGVPRIASSIAGDLCGAYGILGNMERAQQFGMEAVAIGQSVCSAKELARTSLEVAMVQTILGDVRSARQLLTDTRARISDSDTYLNAIIGLYDADADLADGHYRRALERASASERVMERLQATRFLGSALRIEAEAHEGLGQLASAVRSIGESVRILEASGHAYTLARAYSSSARISKKWTHRLAADDLLRALHA
jgi:tetratricopeptide (TPR) repeat protein